MNSRLVDPRRAALLLAILLFGVSGCGRRLMPTVPEVVPVGDAVSDLPGLDPEQCRHGGAVAVVTRTPDGALDAFYRPARWNGGLVVYAHGYIAPGSPIALPTADDAEALRDSLLGAGYAVAYSSYAENGFAVRDGIEHTRDLDELFARRLGHPRRTYLVGHSLGGLVALALAERYPHRYGGALVMSGITGGSQAEIDYVANVRVLLDYFYPGVLPGDLLHLPPGVDLNRDVVGPTVAAIQADPARAFAIAQILRIPFASPDELVTSIVQALVFQVIELQDLLSRTGGESFFDNSRTIYAGPLPPELLADLNARVARYHASDRVERYFERFYRPTGRLEIPVLSLHATRDPSVPLFHELLYRERVAAHGDADLLVQRFEDRFGHTGFPPGRMMAAFRDLVAWVEERDRDRCPSREVALAGE